VIDEHMHVRSYFFQGIDGSKEFTILACPIKPIFFSDLNIFLRRCNKEDMELYSKSFYL
jgi:hypothetical protein